MSPLDLALQTQPWWQAGWSVHISPSSLGRCAACPRSEAMPHVHDNAPAARKGTIAHKFLADCLDFGRDRALGMVEDVADIEWLSMLDLERLPAFDREAFEPEVAVAYNPRTRTARCLGKNLSRSEARALAEDFELVGIIDVLGVSEESAVAHDYKTGWGYVEPTEVNWQLKTYALFAARWLGKSSAIFSVIRARDNGSVWFDLARMDELDLMAHEDELLALLERRESVRKATREGRWAELPPLVEGKHCRYCPAFSVCPAKVAAIRVIGTAAEDTSVADGPISLEEAALAWKKVRAAQKTLLRYESILRDLARQEPIPLGEGEVLGEKQTTKESVVPEKAREVLERQFGPVGAAVAGEAMKTEASIPWGALKSALKRLVLPTLPPGEQKISWLDRDVRKLLRESGAVTAVVSTTVTEWVPKAELPAGEEAA